MSRVQFPVLASGDRPVSGDPTLYISTQRHAYTSIAKMKNKKLKQMEAWVGRGCCRKGKLLSRLFLNDGAPAPWSPSQCLLVTPLCFPRVGCCGWITDTCVPEGFMTKTQPIRGLDLGRCLPLPVVREPLENVLVEGNYVSPRNIPNPVLQLLGLKVS